MVPKPGADSPRAAMHGDRQSLRIGLVTGTEGREGMAFADNLKQLTPVTDIEKLELLDAGGKIVAAIENKPGQAGSLAVYHHLVKRHGSINKAAALEGLDLYAEHSLDAEQNPGRHPNIDRLFGVVRDDLVLDARIRPKP
jgi:hypothetical protein